MNRPESLGRTLILFRVERANPTGVIFLKISSSQGNDPFLSPWAGYAATGETPC
jgi:hypothetical protein